MSTHSPVQKTIYKAIAHIGGAKTTKTATRRTCFLFADFCAAQGDPLTSIKTVTFDQVKAFIEYKKSPPLNSKKSSVSTAALHNIVAQIRSCVSALHGKPDQLRITAKNLGLPPRCRRGTKLPISDEVFFKAVKIARSLGEIGFAISIKLERYFGHRSQEAIMSGEGIKTYILELQDLIRITQLDFTAPAGCVMPELAVEDGTKGNRPRVTVSIKKYLRESLETLLEAITYLQTHKFLVQGKTGGLKAARARSLYLARKCGLTGKFSQHSCRYRYAHDKLEEYKAASMSREDAFRLVTKHLGHGPSRANAMITAVYGQAVAKTFPRMPRKRKLSAEIESLEALLQTAFEDTGVVTSDL